MGADICTARCHCTADGNSLRDTDIEPFLSSDIDNQDDNPVLVINDEVLIDEAARLEADDPVAQFLSSSAFTSVAPMELEEEGGDNSAAGCAVISITALLLAVLLVAFA
jgi:hypothetical protein